MKQTANPDASLHRKNTKATVISNIACLLIATLLGSFPLILWAHWKTLALTDANFVYPISIRSLISFYWLQLLPKSGVLLAMVWLCALVGYANQSLSRRILEAVTSLVVGWLIASYFFGEFLAANHFFENR